MNRLERLESAARSVRHARDIRASYYQEPYEFPYVKITGPGGQLSIREAEAWANYLNEVGLDAVSDLLRLAQTVQPMTRCENYTEGADCFLAGRIMDSPYGAERVCDPCRIRQVMEPLLKDDPS